MSEPQQFMCPGTYFGRYCSDEREYEYARTLERDNKEVCKELENYGKESRKLREEIDGILKRLKEKGLKSIQNHMSDYEKYQQLKKYTPSNPKTLINQSDMMTTIVRGEIVFKQRILCLLPLYHPQIYPKVFPENRQLFYKHISQGIEVLKDTISPQQIQFISKVYSYFYENPHELVNVILSIEKKEESLLSFIIYSTIPSFFGYFSCIEHLSIAFSFYCALIMKAPKHIIEMLLRPFFGNSTTYRFIEGLSADVIDFFCQDIRVLSKNKTNFSTLINEHSINFLNSIIKNLKFLPKVHLNILQFMNNLQWNSVLIFELFLSSFIVPQLVSHLSSSNSSFSLCSNEFFLMVNNLKLTVTEDQLKPFFVSQSIYEIPPGFQDFDLPYISFLTTPLDASIFFEAAKPIVKFPKLLIMLQSEKFFGRTQPYAPIWVKVFPRAPKPILYSDSWRNLIFNFDGGGENEDKEKNKASIQNSGQHQNSEQHQNSNQHQNSDQHQNSEQHQNSDQHQNSEQHQNSNQHQNSDHNIRKPSLKIPHFKRELAMVRMIASEMGVDVFDIITGSVKCPTAEIIQSNLHDASIDLTGICDSCLSIVASKSIDSVDLSSLCCSCKDLVLHHKKRYTFIEYALKVELHKLHKQAVLFEKLLLYQFSLNRLKNWLESVRMCFNRNLLEIAETVLFKYFSNTPIQTIIQREDSPHQILTGIFLFTKKSGQFFYCLRSEKILNLFQLNSNHFVSKIKKLDEEWSKEKVNLISEKKLNKIVYHSKSSVFYQIFASVTNMVNLLTMIPFHRRFFLIIDCLKQFNDMKTVTKSDTSILDFLKFSSDSCFLISVIEISSLMMKSPHFLNLCSKEETLLWYQLENELQNALSHSKKLSQLYNELHDFILQLASAAI